MYYTQIQRKALIYAQSTLKVPFCALQTSEVHYTGLCRINRLKQ